jgi:CheY-like chemotaxis protein
VPKVRGANRPATQSAVEREPVGRGAAAERTPKTGPRSDLAAALHETTNALTVILGWIERARSSCGERQDAVVALDRAARHARAARDSMRRTIGAELPETAPVRAAQLVAEAVDDLAVEAQRSEVEVVATIGSAEARVAHPHAVWQILTNLLLNAVSVTPRGGRVAVELEVADDDVMFRVRDQGPGIDPREAPEIFAGRIRRRQGGAGIGLKHAHALAADLDGELSLGESEEGACFVLRWPAAERASTAPLAPSVERSANLEGSRVLVLEDDAAVSELLDLALSARGAAVTSVTTAADLERAIQRERYDLLLIDLSPLAGELEATLAKVRAQSPDSEVVVISGSVNEAARDDVLWVRKPFAPHELLIALARRRAQG